MLQIGPVIFDDMAGESMQVPTLTPFARRETLLEGISLSPETYIFSGVSESFPVRFASGESFGLLPVSKRNDLWNLYNAGGTFSVVTDYLRELGDVHTYEGVRFDPSGPPAFSPSPVLDLWYCDMVFRFYEL